VVTPASPHIVFDHVTVTFGHRHALSDVSVEIPRHRITAVIGPANAGKTTMLRCINRTLELRDGASLAGIVSIDGEDVMQVGDVHALRRRVGMVSPLPVGLPLSVYDNVAYAPRLAGVRNRADLDEIVEHSLRQAALWDEVKDRLDLLGTRLSGGQQQRLAIARALSHTPEVLCLNRFSIAIDPVTTTRIEETLHTIKHRITVIVATNLVPQARRLADDVIFLNRSALIEHGPASVMFSEAPAQPLTFDYVRGRIG
jgi:phosphate transport system ATP-binding protein